MSGYSEITWIAITAVAAFGLVQVLRALAISVRNETMIHDLRVRVVELQIGQFHAQMLRQGVPHNDAENDAPAPVADETAPPAPTPGLSVGEQADQAEERAAA